MENLYCCIDSIKNESDVEQKFLYKFLSTDSPIGLGYSDIEIDTKKCIKAYTINKGKVKSYIPDYIISVRGIPLIIVEAKNPNEDLYNAFAEAQLYAQQINNKFTHKINPCTYIIVSNGNETWLGYVDSIEPVIKMDFNDFKTDNVNFNKILDKCQKNTLDKFANDIYKKQKAKSVFKTPISFIGGKATANKEMISNDFGNALISDYRSIFDPQTEEDRIEIVKNAYVHSKRREQHIEPIYREIKKIQTPSKNATLLSTDKPIELISQVENQLNQKEKNLPLFLLIGSRGSGKTTFIRYFKEKIMDEDYDSIANKCEWCFLDINHAPLDRTLIYSWVKENIINNIKKKRQEEIDFDTKEYLEKLYNKELNSFKKGAGKFIEQDTSLYNKELFNIIVEASKDSNKTLSAYIDYLKKYEQKVPIVVFDNCDKSSKDDQLLIFEVAQWLRTQYKCIVMVPMRDLTYDIYKDTPPLDTFVRDLVFRIDPPNLLKVLLSRLEYIERLNKKNNNIHYTLNNGVRVRINPDELIDYFRQILHVIGSDRWAKNIFFRLTNGDIRGAIQLFEDLCKSGHINTSEILGMKLLGSEFYLAPHKLMNALLRKNRKYFVESNSNFINIFASNYNDDFPDPFVRLDILYWLKNQKEIIGPNGILGYNKIQKMIKDLQTIGHSRDIIFRELEFLIRRGLIISENQQEQLCEEDLIKISSSGSLHIMLISNISYLSACAESVLYKNDAIKEQIGKRLATQNYLDLPTQIANAMDMFTYLKSYKELYVSEPESYLIENCIYSTYNLDESIKVIENLKDNIKFNENFFNTEIEGKIVYIENEFILVRFGDNLKGFLAINEPMCGLSKEIYQNLSKDDLIKCKVLSYNYAHNSYKLLYLKD